MGTIVLIDTSVFLNILDVPGFNQDREYVFTSFERYIDQGSHFLLPMATIWETGNHIARIPSGAQRRRFAESLLDQIKLAFDGEAPFRATYFPDRQEFFDWLGNFPDFAMRNKSECKPNEGISLCDMSIIKEWERTVAQNASRTVLIWSLDIDLASYFSEARI